MTQWEKNFEICKSLTIEDINSENYLFENVSSFNNDFEYYNNDKIKYLIVGTLTPYEGRQRGYFYGSPSSVKNGQIKILSEVLKEKNFTDESKELLEAYNLKIKTLDKNKIEKCLSEIGIAFLDVIKKASSIKFKGFASDDLIYPFCLDNELILKIFENRKDIVFICNSKMAKHALTYVLSSKHPKECIEKRVKYAMQYLRGRDSFNRRVRLFSQFLDIKTSSI